MGAVCPLVPFKKFVMSENDRKVKDFICNNKELVKSAFDMVLTAVAKKFPAVWILKPLVVKIANSILDAWCADITNP
jgi:hypothetical protein